MVKIHIFVYSCFFLGFLQVESENHGEGRGDQRGRKGGLPPDTRTYSGKARLYDSRLFLVTGFGRLFLEMLCVQYLF